MLAYIESITNSSLSLGIGGQSISISPIITIETSVDVKKISISTYNQKNSFLLNKTLGRAQDPRANGAWLSKLTE